MIVENYNGKSFLKLAAICSFIGALTTALLIFLPNPDAPDLQAQSLLYENKMYLTKLWILFVHPQVNIIASLGVAFVLYKKYPTQIILGTLFLLVWAYSEMSQQALLIDALNQIWRPGYLAAENEEAKNMFTTLIKAANGISASKYFLVIYGFGLGSLLFGAAFFKEQAYGKWIGIALIFIGLLSLFSFARYYLELDVISPFVNWCYQWIYPYLQPLVRIAIGLWLYNQIKRKVVVN